MFQKLNLIRLKDFALHIRKLELLLRSATSTNHFAAVYPLSENLRNKRVDSKPISKLEQELLKIATHHICRNAATIRSAKISINQSRSTATNNHFPDSHGVWLPRSNASSSKSCFYIQPGCWNPNLVREEKFRAHGFHQPRAAHGVLQQTARFRFTNAQKRVIKEILCRLKIGASKWTVCCKAM